MAVGSLAGRVLGKYRLLKLLGKGGKAEVYLAEHQLLESRVAVKVLPGRLADDQGMVERFLREARSAARLRHPHIVRIHDVGQEDGVNYFAMDYIQGQTLTDLIRERGCLAEADILAVSRQILQALAEAHGLGIVHRDIKPDNVIIDSRGDAVVMDFGIAKARREAAVTIEGYFVGTPFYASPEQAQGKSVDARSDIYSLGVTMYEMAAGRAPFEGEDTASTLYRHVHEEPRPLGELNPELSPGLCALVARCLAKAPSQRFASASEMLAEIDRLAQDLSNQAAQPPAEPGDVTIQAPIRPAAAPPGPGGGAPRERDLGPRLGSASDFVEADEPRISVRAERAGEVAPAALPRRSGRLWIWLAVCLALAALAAWGAMWFLAREDERSRTPGQAAAVSNSAAPALPPAGGTTAAPAAPPAVSPATTAALPPPHSSTTLPVAAAPPAETAPSKKDEALAQRRLEARLALMRGVSRFNSGRYQEAVDQFRRSLAVYPQDAQAKDYLDKALARLAEQDAKGAAEGEAPVSTETDKTSQPNPAGEDAPGPEQRREARLALVQGVNDFNSGRYKEAAENFLRFTRVFPEDPQGRDYLRKAQARLTQKEVGAVVVKSDPDGEVFLDGESVGFTPTTLKKTPVGRRLVEVRALGGRQSREIQVRSDSVLEVSFHLQGGVLAVRSRPRARVFFQGRDLGLTPLRAENLPLGRRSLVLRQRGYRDQKLEVMLRGDRAVEVDARLQPLPGTKPESAPPAEPPRKPPVGERMKAPGETEG